MQRLPCQLSLYSIDLTQDYGCTYSSNPRFDSKLLQLDYSIGKKHKKENPSFPTCTQYYKRHLEGRRLPRRINNGGASGGIIASDMVQFRFKAYDKFVQQVTSNGVMSTWGFMPEHFFLPLAEADSIKGQQSLRTGYTRFELTFYVENEDMNSDSAYSKHGTVLPLSAMMLAALTKLRDEFKSIEDKVFKDHH
jgi:hypothetical protein